MTLESKSIHEKLFKIQQEIGAIAKDSENPFFKSKYFDINQLIKQLEPFLKEHKLLLLQPLVTNEFEQNGVETQLIEVETGSMVTSFCQFPQNNDPQKMGSAITYLRRYTLQSLLGLQAEDDDANKASGRDNPIKDYQITKIDGLIHSSTIEEKVKVNIEKEMTDMTFDRAKECIAYLQENQKPTLTDELEKNLNEI